MPRLKNLSGPDVVRIFVEFEFLIASQRGSHVKLRRVLSDGTRQTLTIPNHRELGYRNVESDLSSGASLPYR